MRRGVLLVVLALGVVLLMASQASAAPRKLCYADAHSGVFARNTSCDIAEAVVEAISTRYKGGLHRFSIRRVYGTWGCGPYVHDGWNDIICRSGIRAVGVAIKE